MIISLALCKYRKKLLYSALDDAGSSVNRELTRKPITDHYSIHRQRLALILKVWPVNY